jgi:hypothetical protein
MNTERCVSTNNLFVVGRYLIWNVLMACPHWNDNALYLSKNTYQVHRSNNIRDPRPHCICLEVLLEFGFPADTPDKAVYSCADLAAMKKIVSVFYVAIKRRPTSPRASDATVTAELAKAATNTHFQAMHYCVLWRDIDNTHFRDVAIASTAK